MSVRTYYTTKYTSYLSLLTQTRKKTESAVHMLKKWILVLLYLCVSMKADVKKNKSENEAVEIPWENLETSSQVKQLDHSRIKGKWNFLSF